MSNIDKWINLNWSITVYLSISTKVYMTLLPWYTLVSFLGQ